MPYHNLPYAYSLFIIYVYICISLSMPVSFKFRNVHAAYGTWIGKAKVRIGKGRERKIKRQREKVKKNTFATGTFGSSYSPYIETSATGAPGNQLVSYCSYVIYLSLCEPAAITTTTCHS